MKLTEVFTRAIFVSDNAGNAVNTLVNTDFTKLLLKNGVSSAETVTVTFVSDGTYSVSFTPLSKGTYQLRIKDSVYNPQGWLDDNIVVDTNDNTDVMNSIAAKTSNNSDVIAKLDDLATLVSDVQQISVTTATSVSKGSNSKGLYSGARLG